MVEEETCEVGSTLAIESYNNVWLLILITMVTLATLVAFDMVTMVPCLPSLAWLQ
jgi:hypothetical protein